ncbi:Protein yippee-like [Hibiscus syriacus]|uniref:Protein yippee-like n=1 Tax=Hibiscus syriacus TaxID=106335 RepID=A0A6A2ZQI3_HIBSY|nr:Protein yippee-like [Hibiscus syriacus]
MESSANPLYRCSNCRNPLALVEDLLSKNFIAKSGKAYMFQHAMNVVLGPKYDKQLIPVGSALPIYSAASAVKNWGGNMLKLMT